MLRAAVIGLGNIGIGFDLPTWPDPNTAMSHSKAFLLHGLFTLECGIDISSERRKAFSKYTRRPAYADIGSLKGRDIDIVSVCVPTDSHAQVIKRLVSQMRPKCILCEKPITDNLRDYKEVVDVCRKNGVRLAVNYPRRWDIAAVKLKRMFLKGYFGSIRSVHCWYTKGLLNSASHAVDLVHYWFGNEKSVAVTACREGVKKDDPDVSFISHYNEFEAMFQGGFSDYNLFEIGIIAQKGRIVYHDSGQTVGYYPRSARPLYRNFYYLEKEFHEIRNDLKRYQYNVMSGLGRSLTDDAGIASDEKTAGDTLKTCLEVRRLCRNWL